MGWQTENVSPEKQPWRKNSIRIKWIYHTECWQAPAVLKRQQVKNTEFIDLPRPQKSSCGSYTWEVSLVNRTAQRQSRGRAVDQFGDLTKAPHATLLLPGLLFPICPFWCWGNWLQGGKEKNTTLHSNSTSSDPLHLWKWEQFLRYSHIGSFIWSSQHLTDMAGHTWVTKGKYWPEVRPQVLKSRSLQVRTHLLHL